MKNIKKMIVSILVLMLVFTLFAEFTNNYTYASTGLEQGKNEKFENDNPPAKESLNKARDTVVTIARVISSALAIIMLMVLGMKYIISSPGDRADVKKHAVVYVVGAFILFAVPGIIGILIDIGEKINE